MEDFGGRSMGSLDDGVKRDTENNTMKISLIRSLHRTLFGLSSCGWCFVWRSFEAKREMRNTYRIVVKKPFGYGDYSDYVKKTYEQGM
jgi:hypothetical protein